MKEIQLVAPGKINLALDITGTRADGYHFVSMVMQSVSLADTVTMRRIPGEAVTGRQYIRHTHRPQQPCSPGLGFDEGPLSPLRRVEIFIDKEIPVAGGMAGGSSDAAAVLNGVNRLFDLELTEADLAEISLVLGADLPFCISGGTVLAEGIGEILTPLPALPQIWLVLVNPGFALETAAVYRCFDQIRRAAHPDVAAMVAAIRSGDQRAVRDHLGNILEPAAFQMHPQLAGIKQQLAALGLRPLMSGSGPTFFAMAENEAKARQAASQLAGKWPFVTAVSTR